MLPPMLSRQLVQVKMRISATTVNFHEQLRNALLHDDLTPLGIAFYIVPSEYRKLGGAGSPPGISRKRSALHCCDTSIALVFQKRLREIRQLRTVPWCTIEKWKRIVGSLVPQTS